MAQQLGDWKRDRRCAELGMEDIGKEFTLMGWVARVRNMGGILFIWLRDRSGIIQLVFDARHLDEAAYHLAESLRPEYVLAVRGRVTARDAAAVNEKLATGAIEVQVREAKLLNEAATPPIYTDDGVNENEAVRLKYRYLGLRRPSMQRMLRLRSQTVNAIRGHMIQSGFVEVETPIMTKSTPEGARDYLVPSRVQRGRFYALPQSPQIFKQLLMVSGFEKYFQIVRCFRDEDLRADRQPEFTQIDLEMSFPQQERIFEVVEPLVKRVAATAGFQVEGEFPRLTYQQAMRSYGIDKPDLRIPPSINTAKRIHKLYIRAGNILAGRAIPPGENNMEVIHARPAGEVFAFVPDQTNGPKWQAGLAEVRRVTPGPIGVGTEHVFVRRFAGRRSRSRETRARRTASRHPPARGGTPGLAAGQPRVAQTRPPAQPRRQPCAYRERLQLRSLRQRRGRLHARTGRHGMAMDLSGRSPGKPSGQPHRRAFRPGLPHGLRRADQRRWQNLEDARSRGRCAQRHVHVRYRPRSHPLRARAGF